MKYFTVEGCVRVAQLKGTGIPSTPQHEISFQDDVVFELKDEEKPAPVGDMEIIFSGPITSRMTCASGHNMFQKSRCLPVENMRLYKKWCTYPNRNLPQGGLTGDSPTKASMVKAQFKCC